MKNGRTGNVSNHEDAAMCMCTYVRVYTHMSLLHFQGIHHFSALGNQLFCSLYQAHLGEMLTCI